MKFYHPKLKLQQSIFKKKITNRKKAKINILIIPRIKSLNSKDKTEMSSLVEKKICL